jgi:hypothetical protein
MRFSAPSRIVFFASAKRAENPGPACLVPDFRSCGARVALRAPAQASRLHHMGPRIHSSPLFRGGNLYKCPFQ